MTRLTRIGAGAAQWTLVVASLAVAQLAAGCAQLDTQITADPSSDGDTDVDSDSDGDTDADSDTDADTDTDTDTDADADTIVDGCEGQKLRKNPVDLGKPGPWPVGCLTTNIVQGFTTEVWYPAVPGSEAGKEKHAYDIREHIKNPGVISDEENPLQHCNCYRDLPLDTETGPFPVVALVHGTAGFRTQDLEQCVHWASRGFVVVSSDHPGICFKDLLQNPAGAVTANQARDVRQVFLAMNAPTGDIAFLEGHIDMSKKGAMGHSAGAGAISKLGDICLVLIPHAGTASPPSPAAESALFTRGNEDSIGTGAPGAYAGAPAVKRLLTIDRGEHLVGTSMCVLRDPNDPTRDLLDFIQEKNIGGVAISSMAAGLFKGCNEHIDDDEPYINVFTGIDILNYGSAGVLEETLHCSETAADQLRKIKDEFGEDVAVYQETLQ